MAKSGQLCFDAGVSDGNQVILADWVHDSLQVYSEDVWTISVGRNFCDIG